MIDWYGYDRGLLEISEGRHPKLASDIVEDVLDTMGRSSASVLSRAITQWPEAVGTEIARRSRPVSLYDGVLSVEVDSSTWQYVLEREHKDRILSWLR